MEACRPAVDVDLATIASLAREMLAELTPLRGGPLLAAREARSEPLEATYAELLTRDGVRVAVGSIDDVVVGFGVVEVEELRTGDRLGIITDLYVEPGARSVGVGDAIVATLLEFCRSQGCSGVDGRTLPGHRATKNFFEEHGFTARALVMHHRLANEGSEPPS